MKRRIGAGGGCAHFVTFSTFGRGSLLASAQARQVVISQLGRLTALDRVKVSGFVIMPDHVHAVLWFEDDSVLPGVMQVWKSSSSQWLRMNPVKKGLCARPEEYPWSSARWYLLGRSVDVKIEPGL